MFNSSDSMRATADQMVVSVGPYIFQTGPQVDSNRAERSRSIASPPHNTFSRRAPRQPESNNIRQVAGVACMTVALEVERVRAKATPSRAVSRLANSIRAPVIKGKNNSSPAMSNASVVTASSTSSSVRPGSCAIEHKKFVNARCSISTPLGRPVEPEV